MVLHSLTKMYSNHSMLEDLNHLPQDSLVLYEATGYTRWDEAYGINEDDVHLDHLDEDMSTGSDTTTTTSSGSDDAESGSGSSVDDSNDSEKRLLINNRDLEGGGSRGGSCESECFTNNDDEDVEIVDDNIHRNQHKDDGDDDDSEDEITHKPISAKEVIDHNKLFGYKTADYWWVHDNKVYSDYFVAYLRPMTYQEMAESTKQEVRELKRELANDASLSETLEEFEKVLSRFEVKLNRQPSIPGGDPNLLPFPTPHDFIPTDMRKWICNWQPFDFEIEPRPLCEPIYSSDSSDNSASIFRPWLDHWEPFDMEISGECAWKCAEPELFAKDVLTKKQCRLLEAREKRTDMDDKARMVRRRNKLMNYFKKKYHKSDADLEKYSKFIQSLEENSIRLQCLC